MKLFRIIALTLLIFGLGRLFAQAASLMISQERIMKTSFSRGDLFVGFDESGITQSLIAYELSTDIVTVYSCETLSTTYDVQYTAPVKHGKVAQSAAADIPSSTCGGKLKSVSFSNVQLCDLTNSICVAGPDMSGNF